MCDQWADLMLRSVEGFLGPTDCTKLFTDGDLAVNCKQFIENMVTDMDPRIEILRESVETLEKGIGYGTSTMTYVALVLSKYADRDSFVPLRELVEDIQRNMMRLIDGKFKVSHNRNIEALTPIEKKSYLALRPFAPQLSNTSSASVTVVESKEQSDIAVLSGCIVETSRPRNAPAPPTELVRKIPPYPHRHRFRCCFILSVSEGVYTSQGTSLNINYPDELQSELHRMKNSGINCLIVGEIKSDLLWELCQYIGIHIMGDVIDVNMLRLCEYLNCCPLECIDLPSPRMCWDHESDAVMDLYLSMLPGDGVFIVDSVISPDRDACTPLSVFYSHPLTHARDRAKHSITKQIHKFIQLNKSSKSGATIPDMGFFETVLILLLRKEDSKIAKPLEDTLYSLLVRVFLNQGVQYGEATEIIDTSLLSYRDWLQNPTDPPPDPPLAGISFKGGGDVFGSECLSVKFSILSTSIQLARVLCTTRILQPP